MEPEAAAQVEEADDSMDATLASMDPDKAQQLLKLMDALDDPEVRAQLLESS